MLTHCYVRVSYTQSFNAHTHNHIMGMAYYYNCLRITYNLKVLAEHRR